MRFDRFISADCFCYGAPDGPTSNVEAVEKLLRAVSGLMGKENTFFGSFPLTRIGATINSHFFYPLPGTPLANTVVGPPDPETLRFLENLTLEEHELGRWKGRLKTVDAMQMLSKVG